MQMTAHGLHVVSGCSSRLHVRQIGIFDSIISLSSKFHAGRRLASRPVPHSIDWNHRGVPPGRKPLRCFRCRSNCYRIRHPDEQMCRIREAEKLERITTRNRTFLQWQFEEALGRHVPHSRHTHERGGRRRNRATPTRDNKRYGNADRRRRLIERPVQPLEKHANFSPITNASGARFAGAKTISGT